MARAPTLALATPVQAHRAAPLPVGHRICSNKVLPPRGAATPVEADCPMSLTHSEPASALAPSSAPAADTSACASVPARTIELRVNGDLHVVTVEPRTTLLDALREQLGLTGTKKGCDRGQCGACTVLIDGRRINACLTLAVMQEDRDITTIEGLADGDRLHPMQAAFVAHDALQCGYCTPGQICSAVAMLAEARDGRASAVTPPGQSAHGAHSAAALTDDEIRERMSGNLCRCGAYPNIVAAIRSVAAHDGRGDTQRAGDGHIDSR
ncbi:(2Fe-2S)-binding protein [Cupriavidus gilardii]|uniref:(2Fe-2S)-binding protein n=1 Tax=Cupriavidus gilardii TaxID=82541 RepID=UPI003B96888A